MRWPSRVDAIQATHEWMLRRRSSSSSRGGGSSTGCTLCNVCAVCGTTLEIVRPLAARTHEATCKSQSHPVLLTMLTTFKRSSLRIRLSPSRSLSLSIFLSLAVSLWYRYSLCALLTLRIYECLTCVMTVISRSHVRLRRLPFLLLFLLLHWLVLLLLLLRRRLQRMCGRWLSIYE